MGQRLAVVTPTGMWPRTYELLGKSMSRQTRRPDMWVVSDDTLSRTGDRRKEDIARNMLRCLDAVPKGHDVVIMQHDDWYGPDHLEVMGEALRSSDGLVGARDIAYYHVGWRTWLEDSSPKGFSGPKMASAFTGIPAGKVGVARAIYQEVLAGGRTGADGGRILGACSELWHRCGGRPELPRTGVSIKGIPEVASLAGKHINRKRYAWRSDPDLVKLREWIGDDADDYARYWDQS